jgi:hypothetical protein
MAFMFYNARSFNRDLRPWCVEWLPYEPDNFDDGATAWNEPRPQWGGTCP